MPIGRCQKPVGKCKATKLIMGLTSYPAIYSIYETFSTFNVQRCKKVGLYVCNQDFCGQKQIFLGHAKLFLWSIIVFWGNNMLKCWTKYPKLLKNRLISSQIEFNLLIVARVLKEIFRLVFDCLDLGMMRMMAI